MLFLIYYAESKCFHCQTKTTVTVNLKADKLLPQILNLLGTVQTTENEDEEEMPYHKIDAILGIMPRRLGLDDNEGCVDHIPLVLNVVGEALRPVDHEADSRSIMQERHETDE